MILLILAYILTVGGIFCFILPIVSLVKAFVKKDKPRMIANGIMTVVWGGYFYWLNTTDKYHGEFEVWNALIEVPIVVILLLGVWWFLNLMIKLKEKEKDN